MSETNIASLGSAYRKIFDVLDDAGFDLTVTSFSPESFGNFVVACRSEDAELRVTNDRGQIFVDVRVRDSEWIDKEKILESCGISMSRRESIDGLWTGYEPGNQAIDLRENLPLLVNAASRSFTT